VQDKDMVTMKSYVAYLMASTPMTFSDLYNVTLAVWSLSNFNTLGM